MLRVLLVEDDVSLAQATKAQLGSRGRYMLTVGTSIGSGDSLRRRSQTAFASRSGSTAALSFGSLDSTSRFCPGSPISP